MIPEATSANSMSKTGEEASKSPAKREIAKKVPAVASWTANKSKIPKQGKVSCLSHRSEASDPPPSARPSSRSQEKPPTCTNLQGKPSVVLTHSTMNNNKPPTRVFENQFTAKKNRYISLSRTIQDKQKTWERSYLELIELRNKILESGGKDPGKLEEILPLPVGLQNHARLLTEGQGSSGAGGDAELIAVAETHLRNTTETLLSFTQGLIDSRNDLIDNWFAELERHSELSDLRAEMSKLRESMDSDVAADESRFAELRQEQERITEETLQRASALWCEVHQLRQERQEHRLNEASTCLTDELNKELRAEKDKVHKLRLKLREKEEAFSKAEAKARQAQDKTAQLESQLKLKDSTLEAKVKEVAKFQKSGDATVSKLEKQLDTAEARIVKLKEELEFKEKESKNVMSECKAQLDDMEREIENERRTRQDLENQFEEFKVRYSKLEAKCTELLDMEEKRKEMIPDDHTEYEIQLFNDLKETQKVLSEKEEIIKKMQIEREEIIAAVNEAGHESDSSKERLTAELMKKSNELDSLRSQFNQLQKNYKRTQQKLEHTELKLSDLGRMQGQMKDGSRASYNAHLMQLQQQLTDLSTNLSESEARNAELETTCTQLQVKLEHYKRYMRNQDKDLKLRKELQMMLQCKDAEQMQGLENLESKLHSVNAEEFQELYATLENKEMQISKLEKLVKQMEKQEEYSQAQRTRLENRIANLELSLKEAQQTHRNRGFSFI